MNTKPDLKSLWSKQESIVPELKLFVEKTERYKRKYFRSIVMTNVLLLSTSAFIGFVWSYFEPEMVSTKIGIVLIILAMAFYLLFYNQMISLLLKTDVETSGRQYLENLLNLKARELFLQTTVLNAYFILLSMGLCLYLFEYTSRMTLFWGFFTYALTLAWIALNIFYFKPKAIKKQRLKIDNLINRYQELWEQLRT